MDKKPPRVVMCDGDGAWNAAELRSMIVDDMHDDDPCVAKDICGACADRDNCADRGQHTS